MPKCSRCGKKGLFLKLTPSKVCNDCQSLVNREQEESRLNMQINSLLQQLSDQQALYNQIYNDATTQALKDSELTMSVKNKEIEDVSKQIIDQEFRLNELNENFNTCNKELDSALKRLQKSKIIYKSIQNAIKYYFDKNEFDYSLARPEYIDEANELLSPTVELKLHNMDVKQLRQQFNQNKTIIKNTLKKYEDRYTTKANIAIYRLMVIALEAELQNVLYSINYGKLDKAVENIKLITSKYLKIATDGNQSIAPTMHKFIGEIEDLFINAVNIEYEYFVQRERIKEEQRALREQMKQEAEERKLLEEQKKQIEKEESKYHTEISNIQSQIESTSDQEKLTQLQEKLEALTVLLNEVNNKKEEILKLQHGTAGHVYIISNLGAFGDKMFKIGMTRRLDPMDRVDELGNASVPFKFDIHSFIFSDNAVGLENDLHKKLYNQRVNKINNRKEFFYSTVDELETLVNELDPTAEFNKSMLAEQYHQSQSEQEITY